MQWERVHLDSVSLAKVLNAAHSSLVVLAEGKHGPRQILQSGVAAM
jgi:hypothetical protein